MVKPQHDETMQKHYTTKIDEAAISLDCILTQIKMGILTHEGRLKDILHEIADDLKRTVVEPGDEIYLNHRLEVEGGDYGTGSFKVERVEDDGTCVFTITIGEPPTQYTDDTYHDVEVKVSPDEIDWEAMEE